jgi:hypothetical protein
LDNIESVSEPKGRVKTEFSVSQYLDPARVTESLIGSYGGEGVMGLERGPLSLVRIIEELFQGNSGSGLEDRN